MGCPDDATILQFVTGELAGDGIAIVDGHIDSCADCRTVVVELARSTPLPDSGPDAVLRRGSQVGRYLIVDVVGSGAMGVVYAAYDPDLNRRVAIKVLRADADARWSADARKRLLREAQAMARLSHPNVVAIFEVGSIGDAVFLAMELVDGVTVRDWLAARERTWAEVRDVFVQAGRGLAAAHEAGLVHRDFKPDNVIVDPTGRVRVTDFGLARGTDDGDAKTPERDSMRADRLDHSMTVTGVMLGTPAYMAPEQLIGGGGNACTDQFAYCVALYEALAKQRPFRAESFDELVHAVVEGPLPEPPAGSAPRWLHAVVARGLSRDPDARYESMATLLADMHADAPSQVRPGRWAPLTAAIVVGGLVVCGYLWAHDSAGDRVCEGGDDAIAAVWNDDRKQAVMAAIRDSGAPSPETTAASAFALADQWRDDWVRMHGATCRATRELGEQSEQLLDVRMQCMQRRLGELDALVDQLEAADAATAARAVDAIGSLGSIADCGDVQTLVAIAPPPADDETAQRLDALYRAIAEASAAISTGNLSRAEQRSRFAVDAAIDIGYLPAIADAKLVRADGLRAAGELDAGLDVAYEALWAAQESKSDLVVARAWLLVIAIAGDAGRYDLAADAGGHARAAVMRVGSPPLLLAKLRNTLGVIFYNQGRYDEARAELTSALELRREHLGDEHTEVARSHTNLGNVARATGRLDEALEHHRAAMAIDRGLLGERHLAAGRHLHNIAGVLKLQGERDAARDHYERALELKRELLGEDHHEVALTHNSLGLLFYEAGDLLRAKHHFERAIAIYDRAEHSDRAVSRHNLGLVLSARGDHMGAIALFESALATYIEVYGEHHERVALIVLALGHAHAGAGDERAAIASYRRAADLADALGRRPEIAAEARQSLARLAPGPPAARSKPGTVVTTSEDPPGADTAPSRDIMVPATVDADTPATNPPVTGSTPRTDPGSAGVYGPGQAWDTP